MSKLATKEQLDALRRLVYDAKPQQENDLQLRYHPSGQQMHVIRVHESPEELPEGSDVVDEGYIIISDYKGRSRVGVAIQVTDKGSTSLNERTATYTIEHYSRTTNQEIRNNLCW